MQNSGRCPKCESLEVIHRKLHGGIISTANPGALCLALELLLIDRTGPAEEVAEEAAKRFETDQWKECGRIAQQVAELMRAFYGRPLDETNYGF